MIPFTKYRKIYYCFSLTMVAISIFSLAYFGINFGIEFTGGSIMEIEYVNGRPSIEELRSSVEDLNLGEIAIQPAGDNVFVLKMRDISDTEYVALKERLEGARENYFESIGPSIGEELKRSALVGIILASMAIVLYIAMTFSGGVGKAIKSWQYGVVAAGVGFFHDVLMVLGLFSLMGHFYEVQVTVPIAVALLTVLGYSINDTVVTFDRIRENTLKSGGIDFEETANKSINETLGRSVSTSLTTLFVLLAIFFLGGETLRYFVLALIFGIILGTYSSLFLAGPLLVSWLRLKEAGYKK